MNAAHRFITLHPGHKDAAYAYYLVALSDYERIADVRRDQRRTEGAVEALEEMARRYPDTPYAADAKQKVILARDHLAGKEMEVGRYYLQAGLLSCRHQPLQEGGDRLPEDDARRRKRSIA